MSLSLVIKLSSKSGRIVVDRLSKLFETMDLDSGVKFSDSFTVRAEMSNSSRADNGLVLEFGDFEDEEDEEFDIFEDFSGRELEHIEKSRARFFDDVFFRPSAVDWLCSSVANHTKKYQGLHKNVKLPLIQL